MGPGLEKLRARVLADVPAKIGVLLGLSAGICVPYFVLQRVRLFPLQEVPATPLDRWIEFDSAWIVVYLSIALLVPLAPLLASGREQLVRYARGLALLCLPSFAAFLLLPVEGPRPETGAWHPLYALLVSVDRPANSFPSLHAGLTFYSLLFLWRELRGVLPGRVAGVLFAGGVLWGAAILFATLATRQHWALDLPAGMLLALGAHAIAWRTALGAPRAGALDVSPPARPPGGGRPPRA